MRADGRRTRFRTARRLLGGVLCLAAPAAATAAAPPAAIPEDVRIVVGGVAGFGDLARSSATARLRHDARAALYIHDYSWERARPELRRRILAVFGGAQDVEFGLVPFPSDWFATIYRRQYAVLGVRPAAAHVNGLVPDRLAAWAEFVGCAKRAGFGSVAPVMSPNTGQYERYPFDSPHWQYLRSAARLGGGLTTDAPSRFFLDQKPAYRDFVMAEIRWARRSGLHAAFIVSPGSGGTSFGADTAAVLDALRRGNAVPDEFIVENYEPAPPPGYPNPVGDETGSASVTAVALALFRRLGEPAPNSAAGAGAGAGAGAASPGRPSRAPPPPARPPHQEER